MTLTDLKNLLVESIPTIKKVFNDGRIFELMRDERNITITPYIEVKEADIDASQQDGAQRILQITANAQLVYKHEIDDIVLIKDALEAMSAKDAGDLFQIVFGEETPYNPECFALPFVISYYRSEDKTA